MKTIVNTLLVLVFAGTCMFAGCYEQHDARVNVAERVRSDSIGSNLIVRPITGAFSALLGEGIEISSVKTGQNDAGIMVLQVSGYNKATSIRRFDYKVEWLDEGGFVIDSQASKWLPTSARPKSSFTFGAVAPNKEAVDFKIDTRKHIK